MALITCPECQKEISSLAPACPHCGFPLSQLEGVGPDSKVDTQEVSSSTSNRETLPRAVFVVIGAVAIIIIATLIYGISVSTVTASNVDTDSFYHSALGVGVRLGQSKSTVDDLLGYPSEGYDYWGNIYFLYTGGLRITYLNGKVDALSVEYPNDTWESKNGIKIDMSSEEIVKTLGEPDLETKFDTKWFYQNGYHIIQFDLYSDRLEKIWIFDAHGKKLSTQADYDAMFKDWP